MRDAEPLWERVFKLNFSNSTRKIEGKSFFESV